MGVIHSNNTKIIAFVAGILLAQCQQELLETSELLLALICIIIFWKGKFWLGLFFILGVLWASSFASIRIAEQLPPQLEGSDIAITGIVANLPQTNGRRTRFDLRIVDDATHNKVLPQRLRLNWYYATQTIQPGQHWRFTVRLKRPRSTLNPGGFDYERWLLSQNIGATGYVKKYPAPVLLNTTIGAFNNTYWRQNVSHYLNQKLGQGEFLGIIKALAMGDRQQISKSQWQLLRITGTVHIVAISGLHIGLVSGWVYFLVLRLAAFFRLVFISPPSIAALGAIMAATAYASLAGFAIPTQRALLMLVVAMLCVLRQRHHRPINVLFLVLLIMVIIDPFAVLSAGFWLSFLAVLIIIYTLVGRLQTSGYGWRAIKVNGSIAIGLTPLLLLFFQQFSLIAPLANLIAVPIVSLWVVPILLLALVVGMLAPELGSILLDIAIVGIKLFLWLMEQLADISFANLVLPAPPLWAVLLAGIGCLLLFMPRGLPGRWLASVFLLPALFIPINKPASGQVRLTLLDVGQGLSAAIETSEHVLVYDAGVRYSEKFNSGESVVLPFLRSRGIAKIDSLLISHGDNDHIGGAAALLQQTIVGNVLTSVPETIKNANVTLCQAGQKWIWDAVEFSVLSPSKQKFASKNDNSCVLKIVSKAGTILLTGDIEKTAEAYLVARYGNALNAEVMLAPHHGSNTSSSIQFLQAVQPKVILIPAGYRNRFGFPDQRVLYRYKKIGAEWFVAGQLGAITVEGKQNQWLIHNYRSTKGKYWNAQ